jgi:selenide,water dikinase
MQFRLAGALGESAPRFALITEALRVLHEHIPAVRKRLGKLLIARDVVLHTGGAVISVMPGGLVTATGRRIAADRIVWATSPAGAPWLAASSLACDPHGFVRVNASLQSVSDPLVFAVGDCATQDGKSQRGGVPPAREGAALAANLRHAAHHEPLVVSKPRQGRLSVITTGPRYAVASWGPVMSEGERMWRLKDRIDRAYLARYHPPMPKPEDPVPPQ